MKRTKKDNINEISDLERVKTLLVLLEMRKKYHPDENRFYFPVNKLLSPLMDEFEMGRAFDLLRKVTKGNIEAKCEVADLFSESTGKSMGINQKNVFIRIRNSKQFLKDSKKIAAMKEVYAKRSNKITEIEINEPKEGNMLRVFINENYQEEINPNKNKSVWKVLLNIAKDGTTTCNTVDKAKDIVDFFNTQRKGRLYSKTGYENTKVLINDGETLSALVPIKLISEKTIQQRINSSQLKTA